MEFKSLRLTCFRDRLPSLASLGFYFTSFSFLQLFYFPLSNAMSNSFQLIPFVRTSSDVINLHQESAERENRVR